MQLPPCPLVVKRRVEFSQTDAAGLIHFSTYFNYMESAEAELLRSLGTSIIWEDGEKMMGFPRVDCQCSFRSPLRFEDLVSIEISVSEITGKSIQYAFRFLDPQGQLCAEGSMVTACVRGEIGKHLSAVLIPESIRDAIATWKNQAS
jgi:YbgC/YbaW family acyl-CoA thioester hydrolase